MIDCLMDKDGIPEENKFILTSNISGKRNNYGQNYVLFTFKICTTMTHFFFICVSCDMNKISITVFDVKMKQV